MSRILVVDDSEFMRDLTVGYLQAASHQTQAVADGKSALAAVKENSPDLAVMDVNLPDISGFQVCRTLRDEGYGFPILIMSSFQAYSPWVHQLAQGFLFKPYSETILLSKVNALLGPGESSPYFPTSLENTWDSPSTFLHHLRSSIGSLSGLLEFAADKKDNHELQERTLQLITQSVSQGMKLMDGYAELLHPISLEKKRLEIAPWLKDAVKLHPISQAQKITVGWELDVDLLPASLIDRVWLKRCVDEILNNAQEAMDGGSLNIGVYGDIPHAWTYVSFQDSGPGMAAYIKEHCVEPFFTLKKDKRGLGLSWADKIARAHGGSLDVSSPKGSGVCAVLKLPNQPASYKARTREI